MPRRKNPEWMGSKDVLRIYEKSNGGRAALKNALAELMRDGAVRTRGVVFGPVEASSTRAAWAQTPKADENSEVLELRPSHWRNSKRWAVDQTDWRWPAGNFSITVRLKPRRKMMARKIQFSGSDLKKLLSPPQSLPHNTRPPDVARWRDFYFAVIKLAQKPGLTYANFPQRLDLQKAIAMHMEGDEWGDSHMKNAVSAVWTKFIEPMSSA